MSNTGTKQQYLHDDDELCPCWQCRWPRLFMYDKPGPALALLYHLEHLQQVLDVGDTEDADDMLMHARPLRGFMLFEHRGATRVGFRDVVEAWESSLPTMPDLVDPEDSDLRALRKVNAFLAVHQMGPYNGNIPRTREGLRDHIKNSYSLEAEEEALERALSLAKVRELLEGDANG